MERIIPTIILLLTLANYAAAQNQNFTVTPAKPEAGNNIAIAYTGKLAKEEAKMFLTLYDTDKIYASKEPLHVNITENQLIAHYAIPDTVSFISVTVKTKDKNDKAENFGINIYQNGKPKKGTFYKEAEALFSRVFIQNDTSLLKKAIGLLEKEYALHPELQEKSISLYLRMLLMDGTRKNNAVRIAQKYYDEIWAGKKKDDNVNVFAYVIAGNDRAKRDSLENNILQKYPNGKTALNRKIDYLYIASIHMPDSAIAQYPKITEFFGKNIDDNSRERINNYLTTAYRNKLDYDNFEKSASTMNDPLTRGYEYNEIAWKMVCENKDLERARRYSEISLQSVKKALSLPADDPEEAQAYFLQQKGNFLDTYAYILFKLGDVKNAVANQSQAIAIEKGVNPEKNERYVQFLIADGQQAEAVKQAADFIRNQKSTPKLDSLYTVAFIASQGDEAAAHTSFAALKREAKKENIQHLKAEMTHKPAPDFTLKDLDGNVVKLSDLKGNIVILDFWATWCGPCIRSFPAMQEAMNQLKDKKVKFLYVNTSESDNDATRKAKIKEVLEKQRVDFHVLLDEQKDDKYITSQAYGVNGIPSKFIIDANGKLRLNSVGFGGDEKLIEELLTAVEILLDEH